MPNGKTAAIFLILPLPGVIFLIISKECNVSANRSAGTLQGTGSYKISFPESMILLLRIGKPIPIDA